jgi:rhodanese-related sulfurtransferase
MPAFVFAEDPAKHVKADEAAKIIAEGKVAIIDVRTAEEFKDGHITGAQNIDIMAADFETQLTKLDKTQPTLVHCQAGGRSMRALKVFEKLGFTNLIHLDEGFGGWEAAGKPVEK